MPQCHTILSIYCLQTLCAPAWMLNKVILNSPHWKVKSGLQLSDQIKSTLSKSTQLRQITQKYPQISSIMSIIILQNANVEKVHAMWTKVYHRPPSGYHLLYHGSFPCSSSHVYDNKSIIYTAPVQAKMDCDRVCRHWPVHTCTHTLSPNPDTASNLIWLLQFGWYQNTHKDHLKLFTS